MSPKRCKFNYPLGWHGKRKIKISEESLELLLKKKCNTNKDVRENNYVFDRDTAPINPASRAQFALL